MNTQNQEQETQHEERWKRWGHRTTRSGRAMAGVVVILVGAALLARQMGVALPEWIFTWEMLLIAVGFYIGAKHNFGRGGWFVPIIIGLIFIVDDIYPDITIGPLFWPVLIIIAGLMMIILPGKRFRGRHRWHGPLGEDCRPMVSGEDRLESVSILGGVKKNLISKDFKGGEIVCIFGGAEISLMQADIQGRVTLEVTQVFGGTKLLIPAHWNVVSEMTAILGGIEDERSPQPAAPGSEEKTLIIKGTTVFGGLSIQTY